MVQLFKALAAASMLCAASAARAQVSFTPSNGGLTSLKISGFETIGDPGYQGQVCLYGCSVTLQRADGTQYGVSGTPTATQWISPNRLQLQFPFGSITVIYRQVSAASVAVDITVQNKGADSIAFIGGTLFVLDMPVVPSGSSDYGTGKLANYPRKLDPTRGVPALSIGFGSFGTVLFSLLSNPALAALQGVTLGNLNHFNSDQRYSFSWQFSQPVAPGASVTASLGITSAKGHPDFARIAGSTAQTYAGALPQSVGQWRDRRPLPRWFLTGPTPHCASGLNPRGWFNNDCSIDTTTTAGLADFRNRMLQWTDTVIGNLAWMNAQGVVIWDIEGQQEPQAVSYVCDPPLLDQVAPEMNYKAQTDARGVADEMVHRIQAAGFKVGLCLRPQRYTLVNGQWQQPDQPDPGHAIGEKVAYARQRWGINIFYVDSNVHPDFGWPIPADLDFGEALSHYPDTLFIPEWMDPRHYGITAPYPGTLRPGATGSDLLPAAEYPGTFGIVLPDEATARKNTAKFIASARRGDIMMPPAWYRPASAVVTRQVYQAVGTRPEIALVAPANGASIAQGTPITLTAQVTQGSGTPAKVEFYTGGTKIGSVTSAPWTLAWHGAAVKTHSLVAKIYDSTGNSTVSPATSLTITK